MKPHFKAAVHEMDGDIQQLQQDLSRLQSAREAVVALYGGDEPDLAPAVNPPKPARGRPKAERRSEPVAPVAPVAPAVDGGDPDRWRPKTGLALQVYQVVRTIAEPFTVASVRVQLAMDESSDGAISGALCRLRDNDYLAAAGKEGRAILYKRAHFPS